MKRAITYMMVGATATLAAETVMRKPYSVKKMARRTMRMFRM